jgi:hypothetical protein
VPLAQYKEERSPEEASEIAGVEDHERPAAARLADAALVEAQADLHDPPAREHGRDAVRDLVQEDDEDPEGIDHEAVPEREDGDADDERQPETSRRGLQAAPTSRPGRPAASSSR